MAFLKKLEGHLVAPKADVNLQLSDQYAVLGDNLEGTLTVTPHEDIASDEIRCEIKCAETVKVMKTEYDPALKMVVNRQVTENLVLYQAKPQCNPAIALANGVNRSFKFSIPPPAGARPTYMSAEDTVQWEIKGVVAVHGRPDVTTKDTILQVVPPSERPANEPLKVRLVACPYCQTEMPETTLTCPNCGAKRTAQ
jgi:hypothetical protein